MTFDLFGNLKKNLEDFNNNKVVIATNKIQENARYLDGKDKGYMFSQKENINLINLFVNSKFQSGQYDTEGQRKIFLNKVTFARDVFRMRTDIDVKNYVFNPDDLDDQWPVWLKQRQFRIWARENNYGEQLNTLGDDYSTYGWCILKKVNKTVEPAVIRNIFCTQDDSKGLDHAAKNGGYCGEIHERMSVDTMKDLGWKTDGLDEDKMHKVYEQYCLVPRSVIDKNNNRTSSKDDKRVLAVQALTLDAEKEGKDATGNVLFIEEIDSVPYEECRDEVIQGRTMPRGTVERLFENQIAANLTANLRRRSLLWSSKKLFQTKGENANKNLVANVRDGQVLEVGINGEITPIATETRSLGEYTADDQVWDKNTQQRSFTYESATGESMPSGTPFRLGVLLTNAVDSYYKLKRQQFGLFLKRSFFSQLIPIFEKETKEHTLGIVATESGLNHFKDALVTIHTNKRIYDSILAGVKPDPEAIKNKVIEEVNKSPMYFVDVKDGTYDVQQHMELDITDESTDPSDIESLTTLYTSMVQAQDPRAEQVLQRIFATKGKNLDAIAGPKPSTPIPQQLPQGQPQQPNNQPLNALTA